jgi:lactate dehydrogenase-like 2-hydroxyacid dehydrogenase
VHKFLNNKKYTGTIDMNKAFRDNLQNRNVLVVGMGKSGKAAVSVLTDCGACVSAQDSKDASGMDADFLSFLRDRKVTEYFGCVPEDMSQFDMLVLSPGVPPQLDFIQAAAASGAEQQNSQINRRQTHSGPEESRGHGDGTGDLQEGCHHT